MQRRAVSLQQMILLDYDS